MQGPKTPLNSIRKVEKTIVIDPWMKVNGEERARNQGQSQERLMTGDG
jgi:hypothetical protein